MKIVGDKALRLLARLALGGLAAAVLLAAGLIIAPASSLAAENGGAVGGGAAAGPPLGAPPGQVNGGQPYPDPLAGFNQSMLQFNLDLDKYIVHPVAKGYADIAPRPVREHVGSFFDNIGVIPRFANNLFQLRMANAGEEVARFGINSTLGVAGFFDVAHSWFGLDEHKDDFGLTLGHYGVGTGPYIVLPFFGPSTARDTVGLVADGAMNPISYFTPWYIYLPVGAGRYALDAVNYRSLHLNLFEEVDRYAIDLYGSIQDAYMQRRAAELKQVNETAPFHF